jgi:hypothetical protein
MQTIAYFAALRLDKKISARSMKRTRGHAILHFRNLRLPHSYSDGVHVQSNAAGQSRSWRESAYKAEKDEIK